MTPIYVQAFQGYGADHAPFGLNLAEGTNAGELLKQSGVRHASAYGLQVSLLALAARAALGERQTQIAPYRALITNGGPWSVETALGFLRVSQDRGPQFVNPLVFPATLVSAGAAAVGVTVGAGAAAIAVGHDELAFFEMLRRSGQLLRRGVADEAIVAAACAPSPALTTALRIAGLIAPAGECSIAVRMQNSAGGQFAFEGATVAIETTPLADAPIRVEARVTTEGLIECEGCDLGPRPLLSAAGGVLCIWALRRHLTNAPPGTELVVSCRRNKVVGIARFRRQ